MRTHDVETEQADRGVEPDRTARQRPGNGQREAFDPPTEDHVHLSLRKSTRRGLGAERGDADLADQILPVLLGGQATPLGRHGLQYGCPLLDAGHHRTGIGIPERHAEFGLRKEGQETRHGVAQADLDYAPRHGADVRHLGKVVAQAGASHLAQRAVEFVCHRASGQPRSVGQVEFGNPEDVALAVVRDDPAFGKTRDDLSGSIEPDEALPLCRAHELGTGRKFLSGCEKRGGIPDIGDIDDAVVRARSAARQKGAAKQGENAASHATGSSSVPATSKRAEDQTLRTLQSCVRGAIAGRA